MIYVITGITNTFNWVFKGNDYIDGSSSPMLSNQNLIYQLIKNDRFRKVTITDRLNTVTLYSLLDLVSINFDTYFRKFKLVISEWYNIDIDQIIMCNDNSIIDDIYKSFVINPNNILGVDQNKPKVVVINVFISKNTFPSYIGECKKIENIYLNKYNEADTTSIELTQKEFNYKLSLIMGQYNLRFPQEIKVNDADSLFEIISKWFTLNKDSKMKFAFRGQSANNEYYCGLVRNVDKLSEIFSLPLNNSINFSKMCSFLEEDSLRRFEDNASLYFGNISDATDFVALAQHFGIATRMLDWTFNPFAAILFSMYMNDNPEGDFYTLLAIDCHDQIYCHDLDLYNLISTESFRKEYTSRFHNEFLYLCNKVTEAYQCLQTNHSKKENGLTIINAIFGKSISAAAQREISHDKSKSIWSIKGKLTERLNDKFFNNKMFILIPSFSNPRIATQQGILQLVNNFDKKEHLKQINNNSIRILIHKDLRFEIIQAIEKMGHNMYKLMPDIQNSCRIIMKKSNEELKNYTLNKIDLSNTKTKILLVYPEYEDVSHFGANVRKEIPPFGVLYLATAIRNVGADVNILPIKKGVLSDNYNLKGYDIVAFSIPSSVTYSIIKEFISKAKFDKKTWKIVGGIHATLFPESVLTDLNVDIVSIGEGEKTLQEIIHNYPNKNFEEIQGIIYRKDGLVKATQERVRENNLDSLGFPARDLLNTENIVMNRLSDTSLKMTHIMCSRGCPNDCAFCCNMDRKIRYRSGSHVRQELEELVKKYGIEGFCIIDDNFIMNNRHVLDIINSMKDLNLKWSALSRINNVDETILKKAKESGCIEIKYGVESGSQRILDKMNKRITVDQIINAIELTHKLGIKTKVFIMHGFPGENMESTKETIEMLDKLKDKIDRISLFRFTPLPGSDVYKNPEKYDLILPDNFDDIYIYQNDRKWWGTDEDKKTLDDSYDILSKYISENWSTF